jgi:hypothetical protein
MLSISRRGFAVDWVAPDIGAHRPSQIGFAV